MQVLLIGERKQHGDSQRDVAHALKISEEAYRNKELGKSEFKMNEMFILAGRYSKKIEDIFLPRKST